MGPKIAVVGLNCVRTVCEQSSACGIPRVIPGRLIAKQIRPSDIPRGTRWSGGNIP